MADMGEVSSKQEVRHYIGQTLAIVREAVQNIADQETAKAILSRIMADLQPLFRGSPAQRTP